MAERLYEAILSRRFAAPRFVVWGLVSDTNRWDRASGLTPGKYTWRQRCTERVRAGIAKELGFDIEWIEPPYEWVEGRFVHGERAFLKGPVARGGFHARLRDVEGKTLVEAVAYVAGAGPLMRLIGPIMKRRFATALVRYLDGIEEVLSAGDGSERSFASGAISASLVARELIAERPYDPLTQGPRSETSVSELDRRVGRLADKGLKDGLVERLRRALVERPDEELAQMRPFELADRWREDRREVLRVFLHATRAGVVDLRWQINCPVCRVAAQVVGALADVSGNVHCAACNIGYGVDFGKHVEAVFQCHPAIRETETSVYCASSPSFLPHVTAQLAVEPQKTRVEPFDAPPAALHVRLLSGQGSAEVTLPPGGSLRVSLDDQLALRVEVVSGEPSQTITISSTSDRTAVVLVERTGIDGHAALGSILATFPDFLDLFATEAPATGVELSIAHLALLFSDLTGSTALYEQIGDARAFAVVQEHFRDMTEIVAERRGAIVKTMGDAVMASFTSETDAVAAALEMVQRCHERHGELGVSAKLGVGSGSCLAVRANDRLDFFGTTVNLAARLQARAEGGQLVITEELHRHPDVRAVLAPYSCSPFKARLKGIASEQNLIAVRVHPQ